MRPSTADELASEHGLDLKRPLRMTAPEDCPSQAAYISYFDDAIAVLQTASALERAALELCIDSAAGNIDYLEVRWAPRLPVLAPPDHQVDERGGPQSGSDPAGFSCHQAQSFLSQRLR